MRTTIGIKLFMAFLAVALLVLGISAGLTRWNFQRGFLAYVDESEASRLQLFALRISQAYEDDGSWDSLREDRDRWLQLMGPPGAELDLPRAVREYDSGEAAPVGLLGPALSNDDTPLAVSRDPLAISPRIAVLDTAGSRLFGPVPVPDPQFIQPIMSGGVIVGELRLNPLQTLANDIDVQFAAQQTRWIYGTSVLAMLMAAIAAMLIARHLVAPVRILTGGTRALADGKFEERIDVKSNDELGQLGKDFNDLAAKLEQHRSAQRQWIADISHELRTPLAILKGELQGVEDGVREPDEATVRSLVAETDRLEALVNDLYELSVSDVGALRYQKRRTDIVELLKETLEISASRYAAKNIKLDSNLPSRSVWVQVDAARMVQLFTNILENSLRYTDEGGSCRVTCVRKNDELRIEFEDSEPGVPADSLPRLFERLYRVEDSRGRGTGGAGIGLAICRNIAEAHDATLAAEEGSLGGLLIRLTLPLNGADHD